jgi:hypothetical protein
MLLNSLLLAVGSLVLISTLAAIHIWSKDSSRRARAWELLRLLLRR